MINDSLFDSVEMKTVDRMPVDQYLLSLKLNTAQLLTTAIFHFLRVSMPSTSKLWSSEEIGETYITITYVCGMRPRTAIGIEGKRRF